jgi:hypothetical protein
VPGAAHDLLDRDAFLDQSKNDGIGLLPAQVSLILDPLSGSEQLGLIVAAPIAPRICRMDLRTVSRKARLAFSIRCHRSATWVACGSAVAATRA